MDKSPEAFRTISEVADALNVPPHVLRFWESRFAQVKPVKRGGGRRYYRPEDVRLLRGIRGLLYDDGMTIKGVQKILRERGIRHVIGLGSLADGEDGEALAAPAPEPVAEPAPEAAPLAAAPAAAGKATTRPRAAAPRPQPDLFEATAAAQLAEIEAPARAGRSRRNTKALRALVVELQALRAAMVADDPET
jgi:DNA-binding transcriptional MerR regulator